MQQLGKVALRVARFFWNLMIPSEEAMQRMASKYIEMTSIYSDRS